MKYLKFRAWDGEQMVSPDYVDRNGVGWWKENSIPTQSNQVMQFTGLYDSVGSEIYKHDVIEYQNGKRGVVIWLSEADGFDFTGWVTTYLNCNCTANGARVIGNVHENPELL